MNNIIILEKEDDVDSVGWSVILRSATMVIRRINSDLYEVLKDRFGRTGFYCTDIIKSKINQLI